MLDQTRTSDVLARLSRRLRIMVREELNHARIIERRQAVVATVNAGPPKSVDIKIAKSDTVIPNVRYLSSYVPSVSDTVWVDDLGGDLIVIGDLA